MPTGMIYLYYRDGSVADAKQYKSVSLRKEIINEWRKKYAAAYYHTFVQIAPVVNCGNVKPNGENKRPYNQFMPDNE